MPKRQSPKKRSHSSRSARSQNSPREGDARFSAAFTEESVGWAGELPGEISASDSARVDYSTQNDEYAELVGERTVEDEREESRRAKQAEEEEKSEQNEELQKTVQMYERQLEMAIEARRKWADQRKEYDEVLKDLKMKLDEAEEKLEAARASKAEFKSRSSMRGMIIVGGKSSQKEVQYKSSLLNDTTAVDAALDDDETDGAGDARDADFVGCWGSFMHLCYIAKSAFIRFILFFNFFSEDVKKISTMYGGTLVPYFNFLQATVALGSLTIVLHAPLLIVQGLKHATDDGRTCGGIFGGICWVLYGGFGEDLGLFYMIVALGSALATLVFSVYNWAKFDRRYQVIRLQTELEGKRRFAKVALAAWDFRLSSEKEKATYGGRVSRALEALKVEDDTEAALKALTPAQKKRIFYKRIIGAILVVFVLAFGWGVIGASTYYQDSIDSYFAGLSGDSETVRTAILFVPAVVVNLLGELAPTTISLITKMEKWPPGVREKQLTWRLYAGNIMNVAVYVALYYELISARSLFSNGDPLITMDTHYQCKEDQAAVSLLALSVSDIVVGNLIQVVTKFLVPAFKKYVLKRRKYKSEFNVAEDVVVHSVSLSLVWMSLVLTPYAALFFPVAMAIRYLTKRLCLTFADIESSGAAEAMSVGVLIMRLFCFTSVVYAVFSFLILCVPLPRSAGCGPFASNTRGLDLFGLHILDVFNPMAIVLLALCIAFILAVVFRNNRVLALKRGLQETVARGGRLMAQLQRDLKRATGQNAVLRARMDKQRRRQEALKDV